MKSSSGEIRVPSHDDTIAPVTILDGQGRLVRVVPATEFRRPGLPPPGHGRERRGRRAGPDAGSAPREGAEP
jgi:hypothetical protein